MTNTILQQTAKTGDNVILRAPSTNGIPPPRYQWLYNGTLIFGETNSVLSLSRLQATSGGQYSVVISNALGRVIHTANLTIEAPYLQAEPRVGSGTYRVWLPPLTNQSVLLEMSTDLEQWVPIYLHPAPVPAPYLDFPTTNTSLQFFRTRPWP